LIYPGLAPGDVKVLRSDQAQITLPPPKIVNIVIDDKQTKVWDRQITWWTPWVPFNPDLERQARLAARDEIEKAALEMGILDQARHNEEESIRALLQIFGMKSVSVGRQYRHLSNPQPQCRILIRMPAYLIVDLEITDPAAWASYRSAVTAVVQNHGGEYVVRGGATIVLEGDWETQRLVVIRFPNQVALNAFWDDPEYQPLKELRQRAARAKVIAVEGV